MKKNYVILCTLFLISACLFLSCKKENSITQSEPNDYKSSNMKMNYYGEILEYTVKHSSSTNRLVVEGKDAKRVEEIIRAHPNALASVKNETEFTFYNHKNEFYNIEEKEMAKINSKTHKNSRLSNTTIADVTFYKDANYYTLSRTVNIIEGIKYNFLQYQPCNAADNWCSTGSYLYRTGVQVPWVGSSENDSYSSLSFVNRYNYGGVIIPITVRVILHEDSNYGGGAIQFELTNVNTGIPKLSAYKNNIFLKTWNDRASSFQCYIYSPNI